MKQFFVNTWATILRVGTALIAVFRGAGQGMTVLAVMMIADYITGVLRAMTRIFGNIAANSLSEISLMSRASTAI